MIGKPARVTVQIRFYKNLICVDILCGTRRPCTDHCQVRGRIGELSMFTDLSAKFCYAARNVKFPLDEFVVTLLGLLKNRDAIISM